MKCDITGQDSRERLKHDLGFLPHVAGLRAVAIILVMLFHLDGALWPHGYLGVDVFLVISGYMLFRSRLSKDSPYSLKDTTNFVYKRFMRIVPPMAVIILLTIAVGLLLMGSGDLAYLCKLSGYALLGGGNYFLKHSFDDYFAQDSSFIPLLHFWYLAVILQVYLLWAAVNYLVQLLPKAAIASLLIVIGLVSLAYCYSFPLHEWLKSEGVSWWEQDKAPSYYQTLPRVWEILAGGLICILPSFRKRAYSAVFALFGLLSILLFSLLPIYQEGDKLPATFIVVSGTILLIRYLPESGLNALLANKLFVWLGGISFSIYLVHLPVFFFWRLWQLGQMDTWDKIGAFLLSLPVGYVFWWCIEKRRFTWWQVAGLWSATMLLCKWGRITSGFEDFMNKRTVSPSYERWTWNSDLLLEEGLSQKVLPSHYIVFMMMCREIPAKINSRLMLMGDLEQTPNFVLMGDSHAAHLYAGMDHTFRQEKISGLYLASVLFPFHDFSHTNPNDPSYYSSPEKENIIIDWLAAHQSLEKIVISFKWSDRLDKLLVKIPHDEMVAKLRQFLQQLKAINKKVILIGPTPEFSENVLPDHFYKIAYIKGMNLSDMIESCTQEQYLERNKKILPYLQQMEDEGLCTFIDLSKSCMPFPFYSDDNPTMLDSHHLSPKGSIYVVKRLLPWLKRTLADAAEQ